MGDPVVGAAQIEIAMSALSDMIHNEMIAQWSQAQSIMEKSLPNTSTLQVTDNLTPIPHVIMIYPEGTEEWSSCVSKCRSPKRQEFDADLSSRTSERREHITGPNS